MDTGLRPLEAGELIDRSVVFWRAHFGPLFRLYLALQLVGYALTKSATLVLYKQLGAPSLAGMDPAEFFALGDNLLRAGGAVVLFGGLLMVAWWVSWVGVVGGTHFTVENVLGRPATLTESVRRMFERIGPATVALFITTVWSLVVVVLSFLPAVALSVAGIWLRDASRVGSIALVVIAVLSMLLSVIGAVLWLLLRFFLVPAVLAEEPVGAWTAVRRAGQLMTGRVGPGFFGRVKIRASVLLTGVGAMLLVITVIASMPAVIVQALYGSLTRVEAYNNVPQALLVPAELLQVCVQAAFTPLSTALAAIFYVDLRVRREGLDLEARVQALTGSGPGPGT